METIYEIFRYKEMIRSMVRRDLRGRYKGSFLGFLWTFLNPMLQLVVYTAVFSTIIRMGIEQYYLFLFVALIPWVFFSSGIMGGADCILQNVNLVTKIYFPREVLPISVVSSAFVNMLYSFAIVLIIVLIASNNINFVAWIYLPIVAICEYFIVLGFAMFFSALTVYFRDTSHILGIITMAWQFLTPVMYPLEMVPDRYQFFYMLNPMTPIIVAFREILFYGKIPDLCLLLRGGVAAFLVMFLGCVVFQKLKKGFAEEL